MGRIKTSDIKTLARQLYEGYGGRFTPDFRHNKEVLKELKIVESKLFVNKVSGYLVRLARMKKF